MASETNTEREQKNLCQRVGSEYVPAHPHLKIGLAIESLDRSPIYGVRHKPEGDTTGWYIWAGPMSEDPAFFKPVHTTHLESLCPRAQKYLGLAPGYKFIIDRAGYEDVWYEPSHASA
ncbi:MAG TPA: hypothetical protein VGM54_05435 [Chthoniobacter sp.]|jgi:hypothetical protein